MKRHGFTLIELLIVIAIIAVLALIAIPNFLEAQVRAKVARTISDMRTVATGLESYAVDWTTYPTHSYEHSTNGDTHSTFEITNEDQNMISEVDNIGLTTPVSHLGEMPRDVFSTGGRHWFGYIAWPGRWILTSYGPDMDGGTGWNVGDIEEVLDFPKVGGDLNVLRSKTYDPTNGTTSDGDIWMSSITTGRR